jgi:hypothetical protein
VNDSRIPAVFRADIAAMPPALRQLVDATLAQVEAFHPPAIVDALWRGLLVRDGEAALRGLCDLVGVECEPLLENAKGRSR